METTEIKLNFDRQTFAGILSVVLIIFNVYIIFINGSSTKPEVSMLSSINFAMLIPSFFIARKTLVKQQKLTFGEWIVLLILTLYPIFIMGVWLRLIG
jgi:predicted permease